MRKPGACVVHEGKQAATSGETPLQVGSRGCDRRVACDVNLQQLDVGPGGLRKNGLDGGRSPFGVSRAKKNAAVVLSGQLLAQRFPDSRITTGNNNLTLSSHDGETVNTRLVALIGQLPSCEQTGDGIDPTSRQTGTRIDLGEWDHLVCFDRVSDSEDKGSSVFRQAGTASGLLPPKNSAHNDTSDHSPS